MTDEVSITGGGYVLACTPSWTGVTGGLSEVNFLFRHFTRLPLVVAPFLARFRHPVFKVGASMCKPQMNDIVECSQGALLPNKTLEANDGVIRELKSAQRTVHFRLFVQMRVS
jgi:hypothetical protein